MANAAATEPAQLPSKRDSLSVLSGPYIAAGLSANDIDADIHHHQISDKALGYHTSIGQRIQVNSEWLLGLEGSIGDVSDDLRRGDSRYSLSHNWHWSLMAGKLFGDNKNQLLYGKLGVGGIKLKASNSEGSLGEHNFKGTRVGFGYERVLSKRMSIATELSYISFDEHINFEQTQLSVALLYHL